MRTIIAGSRTITDKKHVDDAVSKSGFQITEVISGGAIGVDTLGVVWANEHQVPVRLFFPDWSIGKAAGPIRNTEMAENADALILVWDGVSRGSADMLMKATWKGLKVYSYVVKKEEDER